MTDYMRFQMKRTVCFPDKVLSADVNTNKIFFEDIIECDLVGLSE